MIMLMLVVMLMTKAKFMYSNIMLLYCVKWAWYIYNIAIMNILNSHLHDSLYESNEIRRKKDRMCGEWK